MARTIIILGTDFCGSTLFSRLLWCVPGVVAPGELSALVRGGYRGCDICGRECPVLGAKGVMEYKGIKATNVYGRAKRAFSPTNAMVVSDKIPALYNKMIPPGSIFEGIVLFRSPWSHAHSEVKRRRRDWPTAVRHWENIYTECMDYRCKRLTFVDFEAFVKTPKKGLEEVCKRLRFDPPGPIPNDLSEIAWHHVGGSKNGRKQSRVRLDLASKPFNKKKKVVKTARQLFKQLKERSVI